MIRAVRDEMNAPTVNRNRPLSLSNGAGGEYTANNFPRSLPFGVW